ncbi:MAG: isoprenylcysteine carboxylmethyltransferase family protein [Devosia sp.]
MTYSYMFAAAWGVWMLSWGLAAIWASKAAARPPDREERYHWLVMLAGSVLLFLNFATGRRDMLWSTPDAYEWLLVAVALVGFALTWWARIHLGTLWSGRVTRKADHKIIDTGPYAIVRHPIYTGLIVALAATAMLRPGLFGIAGVALIVVSFSLKYRLEERFLMEELGPEYAAYRKRVPALVPFWPVRGP